MTERDHILSSLIKEVLGPRQGPFEILPAEQDPRAEYITGVLAPERSPQPAEDIEAQVDELIEETSSEEDQDTQGFAVVPSGFAPALNPKAQPRSMGISFSVETTDNEYPCIELCATWARYMMHEEGWERHPQYYLSGLLSISTERVELSASDDILIYVRSRQLDDSRWRLSVYLVNRTNIPEGTSVQTPDYVFQPQIRILCGRSSRISQLSFGEQTTASYPDLNSLVQEDTSLDLLYRERPGLARGHLCGAVWREVDPERSHPSLHQLDDIPFIWGDAVTLPESERARFSPPDVRTEFVPCYPVEAPVMNWRDDFGSPPTLDPEVLAELWEPDGLRSGLEPLVEGYRAWIAEQESSVESLLPRYQETAQTHLTQCNFVAQRLDDAINILLNDEDVRLAFCFANKAIAIQSVWSRGTVLTWRPFQLAFILLNIPALSHPLHQDRQICDLLWFPTGGGKTEAYLGLAAFTIALRRRRARTQDNYHRDRSGAGVAVLSRYTLRLLTIQQFRRALGLITSCEVLRVQGLDTPGQPVGWRPRDCSIQDKLMWGGVRFSAGLWVGGNVTPNSLQSIGPFPGENNRFLFYAGALDILKGARPGYDGPDTQLRNHIQRSHLEAEGEPAQIMECPCCQTTLAIPDEGLGAGEHTLYFIFQGGRATTPMSAALRGAMSITINSAQILTNRNSAYRTVRVTFTVPPGGKLSSQQIDNWWYHTIKSALGNDVQLVVVRPSRPGYFIHAYSTSRNTTRECDFEVYCPNPRCNLNNASWAEQVPLARDIENAPGTTGQQMAMALMATPETNALPAEEGLQWQIVPEPFRFSQSPHHRRIGSSIPIPAFTVDDQVYHRCPSLVIATVDKFARLAYEPKAAALFGNVEYYHSRWGYYREGSPPSTGNNLPDRYQDHPSGRSRGNPLHIPVTGFLPPELILQDELHLIEGPLGSMVGLYETAIDTACQFRIDGHYALPKYIASTATVRQAESQVQALFNRRLTQFPPSAISADDRFFAHDHEVHPLEGGRPGRLYVGICAPGKGAQTPIVRIWSSLFQSVSDRLQAGGIADELDQMWTLVGYFNAIRELAGAVSLYRQDIRERLEFRAGQQMRRPDRWMELSSRTSSLNLPGLLERLKEQVPVACDVVFATSMFGTGVDVDRLGLMVVHGQPKTTASYIQATGRVGRQHGGLVVTFFRASRPRDLDHYEFFTGYHRALYRHVEPVTVAPFSPRARERGIGPLAVTLLRQAKALLGIPVHQEWRVQQRLSGAFFSYANRMSTHRFDPEVQVISGIFESRACCQPDGRRPSAGVVAQESGSELDVWQNVAAQSRNADRNRFVYHESALLRTPQRNVVLGDAQHRSAGLDVVYENAPQSLRDVEETTGFGS